MKKILILFLVLLVESGWAQKINITVESFKKIEGVPKFEYKDDCGRDCALIRVISRQVGFLLEVAGLPFAHRFIGEDFEFTFVPAVGRYMNICHYTYNTLENYDLGMDLEPGCFYILKLKTDADIDIFPVNFTIKPVYAEMWIKYLGPYLNIRRPLYFNDGKAGDILPAGDYRYSAFAPGYQTEEGMFTVVPHMDTSFFVVLRPLKKRN